MKILVIGGSGFVGGHLARRLARHGHAVVIGTRHAPAARRLRILPRLSIRQFDPCDAAALAREAGTCDAVVNLVGILNEPMRDRDAFHRAHVELPEAVIEACRLSDVRRLLHMSALNAGNDASRYLATRGEGERRVRDSGLDWTVFRPSTIFGPDDAFLRRFERLLSLSPVLPLARPDARMAPVWVGDVAEAFARALDDPRSKGRAYELCGPDVWRLRDIVAWVAQQRRLKRWIVPLPDGLARLQGRLFDFVPGKPFSTDNFRSLGVDSVCTADGFAALGIEPWAMDEKAAEWFTGRDRQHRYQRFRRSASRSRPGG